MNLTQSTNNSQKTASHSPQSRLQSPVFWTALGAQLLGLLLTCGVLNPGCSGAVYNLLCAVSELLVAFGIFNNPTDGGAV